MTRHGWTLHACLLLAGLALLLGCAKQKGVTLTPEEHAWLAAHPVIRWAPDSGYPPIEWVAPGGKVQGLAPDYLARIGEHLGVRFQPVVYKEWEDVLSALDTGKVDLVSNLSDLPERRGRMLFTQPYLDVPSILLARAGDSISGLDDLKHHRMALERGYVVAGMVHEAYPTIEIIEVNSTEDALQALALGAVDATIADLAQASWTIEHRQLTGIRMVCRLPQFSGQLCMAVRSDQPLLWSILDKELKALTPAQRQELHRKWISLQVLGWHPTPVFWSVLGTGAALAALALVLAWNLALRKRVRQRTEELERTTKGLVDLNAELLQTIAEVRTLRGFISICIRCKKIRNDGGFWDQLEAYLAAHSEARFSHGYCPECLPIAQEEMRRDLRSLDKGLKAPLVQESPNIEPGGNLC